MSTTDRRQRRLLVMFAVFVIAAVTVFAFLIVQDFNRALGPELERRADLIGTTVRDDVERALELGIPLDGLVGFEEYVGALVEDFDGLESVTVRGASGEELHRGGTVRDDATWSSYPLGSDGATVGSVEIGVDARFVGSRLEDLALDLAVIVLVALVMAYEVALAVGERISTGGRARAGSLDVRLVLFVFVVAEELSKSFLPQFVLGTTDPAAAIDPALAVSLPIVAYLLTVGLASPLAGRLLDRAGERKLLAVGLAIASLSHLGMVYADGLPAVIALRGLTGVGYAVVTIACLEYLMVRRPDLSRFGAMGAFVAVIIGGTFVGTALGGILADRLGYRPVFAVGVVLIAAAAFLAWRLLTPDAGSHRGHRDQAFSMRDIGTVLRQPRLLSLLAGVTVPMNVLLAAFLWYLVPLILAAQGDSATVIARTLMLYYLAILLCGPIVSRLGEAGLDARLSVGAGAVASGLVLLLPATMLSTLTVSLAVVVVGICHAAVRGPQLALAVEIGETDSTPAGRGVTLAAMRTLERLGSLIGLLVAAIVAARADLLWAVAAVGVAVALAGAAYLVTQVVRRPQVVHE